MTKLSVKNVGPIKGGCADPYILFDSLTVFLGPQSAGKSTIAKIYASLAWLEKAILRDEIVEEQWGKVDFFLQEVISFQGIASYFRDDSYVHYIGEGCDFTYESGRFSVNVKEGKNSYKMPKIMYVPAERNFLTSISGPELMTRLPRPLHAFLAEYEYAKEWTQRRDIILPIGEIQYRYDSDKNKSYLIGQDYETDLLHGSSGYQSFIPLFLVTEYLSNLVLNDENDPSREMYSVARIRKIKDKLDSILKTKDINSKVRELIRISSKYDYGCFVNVVEEPEQNLYPESQKKALFSLFEALKLNDKNKLVVTSHSPYVLNFIILATEAYNLYSKKLSEESKEKLQTIVPKGSALDINQVHVYELDGQGGVVELSKSEGFLTDVNQLNFAFEEINQSFSDMMELN